jgi:hypothetical protein
LSHRRLAVLIFAAAPFAAFATHGAEAPFTHTEPLEGSTLQVTVDFHEDHAKMVPCTPEQAAAIGARAVEHLTELEPVLRARIIARHTEPGSVVKVLLDAACYDGGIMALGGSGRGDEKIALPYEEATDGSDWGAMKRSPTITEPGQIDPTDDPPDTSE